MSTDNSVKTFAETTCPHCGQPITIVSTVYSPQIKNVTTPANIEKNKEFIREFVKKSNVIDAKKAEFLEWLNDPSNVFEVDDIENILEDYRTKYNSQLL